MSGVSFDREVSLYGEYDIVVLGGGPAGVCSAIASARAGKKVLLVESSSMLGGMATSGGVGPFMTNYDRDGEEKTVAGLFAEIVERLEKYSAVINSDGVEAPSEYTSFIPKYHRHVTPFSSFHLQIVLDEMTRESGVEVLCYTQFIDCEIENGNITHAILSAMGDLIAVKGKIFVDATGIASVAVKAGVSTYLGDEESGVPQPGTLMFEVYGVSDEGYKSLAHGPKWPVKAYRTPVPGHYKINHHHVFNVDASSSKQMTEAHATARKQVLDAYDELLRTQGFENCAIASVAPVLGVRECRHIEGDYKITVQDVAEGKKFDDRIAVYGFGMDVHRRNPNESGNFKIEVAKRYYIPYKSLLPKGVKNLFVAGKTLSCESQAVGGMRCMPSCMAMGHAVGIASAMAIDEGVSIREIEVKKLQETLLKQGAILD